MVAGAGVGRLVRIRQAQRVLGRTTRIFRRSPRLRRLTVERPWLPLWLARRMSLFATRSLDIRSVSRCLSSEPEERGEGCVVDLTDMRFVDAFGLVAIVVQIDGGLRHNQGVRVIHPVDLNVQRYLSRMGLREYMESVGFEGDQLPAVSYQDLSDQLIELTACHSVLDYEKLGDLVFQKIDGPRFYPELTNAVYAGILELGQNVLDHSASERGWVAAQTYKQGKPGEYLVFAVGDAGRGLREGLAVHSPTSDRHAIELAVTEGVSGTGDTARGYGLPTIVTDAREMGGWTQICSGKATGTYPATGERFSTNAHLPGTLVGCWIECQPGT